MSKDLHLVDRQSVGPAGPPGPPGPSGDGKVSRIADIALGGLRSVVTTSETGVTYAQTTNPTDGGLIVGVTLTAVAAGQPVNVQFAGTLTDPSFSWVVGAPVYSGNNGVLTQTYDPTWQWVRILGFAQSARSIWLSIQPFIDIL